MHPFFLAFAAAVPLTHPDPAPAQLRPPCMAAAVDAPRLQPLEPLLRCRFGVTGPGRFGLLSYANVPVYQPATPMPGTHVVAPGHAAPSPGETYEAWEWRLLRTTFGREAHAVHRGLDVLDPLVATRVLRLERRLAQAGVRAVRLETWRAPQRQAYLFQQGRSRPGPLATATLTSWHAQVDSRGKPAGRAVDYDVAPGQMVRFHEIARAVGLESFGADSFDPGHVFLPDVVSPDDVLALSRLARVPEVTLSTGLPVDRRLPAGGRAALRRISEEFAAAPVFPFPTVTLSLTPRAERPIAAMDAVLRDAAEPACTVSRRRWFRPAGGGARCESRKNAGREGDRVGRNTGG